MALGCVTLKLNITRTPAFFLLEINLRKTSMVTLRPSCSKKMELPREERPRRSKSPDIEQGVYWTLSTAELQMAQLPLTVTILDTHGRPTQVTQLESEMSLTGPYSEDVFPNCWCCLGDCGTFWGWGLTEESKSL